MKLIVIYKPDSEHARQTETFLRDLRHQHDGINVQILNAESREGIATAELYGVMDYPAFIAVSNDGRILNGWVGTNFPLMNDVAYYAQAE